MNRIIKYFLKNSVIFSSFYLFVVKIIYFFQKQLKGIDKEIIRRKAIDFFSYLELSKRIPDCNSIYNKNSYYGNISCLKVLNSKWISLKIVIEHGYYFGNYVPNYTFEYKGSTIITFGYERVKHLQEYLKKNNINHKYNVIAAGPYIKYVSGILNLAKKEELKNKYGKILLVFPIHSIEGVNYSYEVNLFINEIEDKAKHFDSIFICLYWQDIKDRKHLCYEKKGYQIITAGHRNDTNFLSRLKDYIDLSDMTMSNFVGTHIGYCLALNKPHYIFSQEYITEGNRVREEFNSREGINFLESEKAEKNEVYNLFSIYSDEITENQMNVYNKYWGNNKNKKFIINQKEIVEVS